jgi:hypothetical protein
MASHAVRQLQRLGLDGDSRNVDSVEFPSSQGRGGDGALVSDVFEVAALARSAVGTVPSDS